MSEIPNPKSQIRNLRARYVFPVSIPPLPGGVVTISGERIVAVGKRAPEGGVEDLGNVAILPGLVNAHTHLEFSQLTEPLSPPGIPFVDWIRLVIKHFRRGTGPSSEAVREGLRQCLRLGTTTLGEIAQPGRPVDGYAAAPPDVTVFVELIAPTPERIDPLLELAARHIDAAERSGRWRPGLSPHAPYSVLPRLLDFAVSLSADRGVPLAFHLAESREELELLRSGSGPFRDLLDKLGTCDPGLFTPGTRPLDYLRKLAPAHRTLVIHGNYLDDEEIGLLGGRADRMSVVYCPRTHAHFAHPPYPLARMLSAGVNVALGTDSRASSPDLSVLAEMRFVAAKHPSVDRHAVLELATIRAARALGREHEVGSLQPGKFADLAIVPLPDRQATDPHDLLFDSQEPVVATWRKGKRVES